MEKRTIKRIFSRDDTFSAFEDVTWQADQERFVAVERGDAATRASRVWTSTNGVDWVVTKVWTNDPATEFLPDNICDDGNGLLFSGGSISPSIDGTVARSSDAITWTVLAALQTGDSFGSCSSDQAASPTMAIGGPGDVGAGLPPIIRHSTDGITWTLASDPGWSNNTDIQAMGFGNSLWLAGTSGGAVASSADAATWTLGDSPFPDFPVGAIRDFQWSDDQEKWVVIDSNGHIATSPDGLTWTDSSSPAQGDNMIAVAVLG